MEININAKLWAEEKEPTERKEDSRRVSSQLKLRLAKTKAESFGSKEAPKRVGY